MSNNSMRFLDDGRGVGSILRGTGSRVRSFLVLALFCIGLLAVWVIPPVAGNAENRAAAKFPALSATTMMHSATYQQIDLGIRDKIGARSVASRAVGTASVDLFGRSPSTAVFLGAGKLPFSAEDFTAPCNNDEASFATVGSGLFEWDERFRAENKYLMYVVPPDKSSVRRAQLGAVGNDLMICSDRSREHLEEWSAQPGSPLLTLWDAEAEQDQHEPGAYLFGDTHWNWQGASVMTKGILHRLVEDGEAPSAVLEDLDTLVFGSDQAFTGDLHRMMGLSTTEEISTVKYDRPGVVTAKETATGPTGAAETRWTSVSDTAAMVPGRTLVYGDSFLGYTESQLPGFFEDITYMRTDSYLSAGELAGAGDYDRVIVERVQRFAAFDRNGLYFDLAVGLG